MPNEMFNLIHSKISLGIYKKISPKLSQDSFLFYAKKRFWSKHILLGQSSTIREMKYFQVFSPSICLIYGKSDQITLSVLIASPLPERWNFLKWHVRTFLVLPGTVLGPLWGLCLSYLTASLENKSNIFSLELRKQRLREVSQSHTAVKWA